MATIHIIVNKATLDAIRNGVVKEIHREISGYWATRLLCLVEPDIFGEEGIRRRLHLKHTSVQSVKELFNAGILEPLKFHTVAIHHGYTRTRDSVEFPFKGLSIGPGKLGVGTDSSEDCFIIKF